MDSLVAEKKELTFTFKAIVTDRATAALTNSAMGYLIVAKRARYCLDMLEEGKVKSYHQIAL